MVEIWRGILKDTDSKEARRKDFRLPVIVPCVLYNSKNNWIIVRSSREIIYAIILIAKIYTTAVGSLYGFTARVTDLESKKTPYVIIGTTLAAFAASRFGFTNLVKYLYAIVGYGGLILLAGLLYNRIKLIRVS
jgi:uncharacterized membrane protein YkvI